MKGKRTIVRHIDHEAPVRGDSADRTAYADLEPYGFPQMFERLWLRHVDGPVHEVCRLPFRVYGLALGDTVEVEEEGRLVTALRERSGNRIFRCFFPLHISDEDFTRGCERLSAAIDRSGIAVEWSGDRHLSAHVPRGEPLAVSEVWVALQEIGLEKTVYWEWADSQPFQFPA